MSTEQLTPSSTPQATPSTPAATPAPAANSPAPSLINPAPAAPAADATPAVEWKEYEPDSNKTDAENAAAKADHDAKKPTEAPKPAAEVKPIEIADIKLPEGMQVDEPVMTEFLGLVNDPKITKAELAQKLVDLQVKSASEGLEKATQAWETKMTEWQDEVRKDPTVGGAKFEQSVATANKVINNLGSPELAQLCADTGIGNNVHFVRFLNAIAPKLLEAAPVNPGNPAGGSTTTAAERMFPSMKK